MSARGYCLFCLDTVQQTDNQDITKTFVKFLEKYTQTDCLNNLLNELNDSKVPQILILDCCQKCQTTVNDFCEVYHKIKCLEIKLGLKLDNLVNKIDQTDQIPTKWHNLRDLLHKIFENDSESNDLCQMFIRKFREGIKTGREKLMQSKQPDNSTNAAGSTTIHGNTPIQTSNEKLPEIKDQTTTQPSGLENEDFSMNTEINKMKCGDCQKSFISQKSLNQHTRHVHKTRCPICRKTFHSKTFSAHVAAIHNPEVWKYQCGVCKEKFRKRKGLNSHMLKCHVPNQRKPAENDLIDEPLKTSKVSIDHEDSIDHQLNLVEESLELNSHDEKINLYPTTPQVTDNQEATGNGDKNQATCGQCGLFCNSKKGLQRHMIYRHTERKISCSVCTNQYRTNAELRKHISKVHSNPENWKWQCKLCEIKFMVQRKFNKHLKSHGRLQSKLPKTKNTNGDPLEIPAPEITPASLPSDLVIKTERE